MACLAWVVQSKVSASRPAGPRNLSEPRNTRLRNPVADGKGPPETYRTGRDTGGERSRVRRHVADETGLARLLAWVLGAHYLLAESRLTAKIIEVSHLAAIRPLKESSFPFGRAWYHVADLVNSVLMSVVISRSTTGNMVRWIMWLGVIIAFVGIGLILLWFNSGEEDSAGTSGAGTPGAGSSSAPAPANPAPTAPREADTSGTLPSDDEEIPESERPTEIDVPDSEKPTEIDEDSPRAAAPEPSGALADEEADAPTDEQPIDFSKCTVAELKSIAKERGLKGISRMKKQDLIDSLSK